MARIETYPLDGNITVNDYVIGTDGDSLNATKNYKVLTFLDYLGTMYNLNSTDLLFNYNNVAAGSVANGQVSTNNFADGTILMSGVTNIYVSKVTAFGQLVDDIINTIGTEGLTIMFTDMGNRNNLGIFTVVSTVDVDANTINMTVTASTAVGSIDAGKVMGIRIGIGGSGGGAIVDGDYGDITVSSSGAVWTVDNGYVDLVTNQNIDGQKTFLDEIFLNDVIKMKAASSATGAGAGYGQFRYVGSNLYAFHKDNSFLIGQFSLGLITANRTYTLQNKTGTIAHLDDIDNVIISDVEYNATSWNNNDDGATKNAIRDIIESIIPYRLFNDFKKTIVSGTGTGSNGGVTVSSFVDISKPIHFSILFENQGAAMEDLVITIDIGITSTPTDVTLPTLAISTATQPILIEGEFSWDGTTVTLLGKITTNEEVIPFFQTFTSVTGTSFEILLSNPTGSGGNVRQEYYSFWN